MAGEAWRIKQQLRLKTSHALMAGGAAGESNMGRTERMRGRRASRGSAPSYHLNFLRNFAVSARLMHSSLKAFRSDENLLSEAIRQYMIGMTSCLETYYRDLFVALLEADELLLQRVFEHDKRAKHLARLRATEPADIPTTELAGEFIKFQNLFGIDQALSEVLQPLRYVDALSSTEFVCIIPSRSPNPALLRLWPQWQGQFSSVFDQRHEFVHDANVRSALSLSEMAGVEATAFIVPQLTTLLVAQCLGVTFPMLAMGDRVPAVLLVEDLIADDWHVAPNEA